MNALEPWPTSLVENPSASVVLASNGDEPMHFGRYCVLPSSRVLLRDGRPVAIGSRAYDLLTVLLRAKGKIVDKSQIMKSVWPSVTVDDCNLRFQVAALRKALGRDGDMIKTVAGRGYLLANERPGRETGTRLPSQVSVQGARRIPAWLLSGADQRPLPCGSAPYIALLEDDEAVQQALTGLLASAGYRAEAFTSIQAFLESDLSSAPACIILDAWLPGQSGLDFQAELASSGVQVPIIFISGHADVPMGVRAIKAGAIEFLTKPVRHEDLLHAIRLAMSLGLPSSGPHGLQSIASPIMSVSIPTT